MQQQPKNFDFEETGDISLGDLFYKFLPYWPFLSILILLSLAGAWIYIRYKLPVYQTTAALLIKDDKNNNNGSNTDLMDALDIFGSKKNVENEVEVLQSKTLMQEVVKNLHLYAPITVEGRVLNSNAYAISPVVVEAKESDSIEDVQKIPFTYDKVLEQIKMNKEAYPLNQWIKTSYGILRFLKNKNYKSTAEAGRANDFYFSLNSVKRAANEILNQMQITPSSKQSTVIDLSIEGTVPKRGEDILNELLKVYNRAAILDKNVLAANTLKFVQDRLNYVVNELDSVENKLQNYKAQNKITDISAQGQIYLENVAANDQKISDINVQLAILDQVEKYVNNKGDLGGVVPSTLGVADPALTDLLQKLSDLELQYTQTKKIVPENNPAVIALVDGIDKLKPGIIENIQSQRKNLVAAKNDLTVNSTSYSSMLKTIPEKERELLSISRQQAIKNNIYTFLLQKREETALSYASAVADSRVIDKAQSSDIPISPKKKLIYLAAIMTALVLGFIIIYIKEILTRTVQQRADIEKNTDIPFLGEVVYDRSKSPIVISEGKRSFIAEQFRLLRTSLSYLGINEAHKKILITSSIAGEGKSFIAINLGISLSLMGKKVILIELDLRKPKLSEQFNISRQVGISNYLINKMQIDEIIKGTHVKNLYLIPSGPIPPNPSELISNNKLTELLKHIETLFDYIIIDTAPVGPVTDALILSPICDVTLFVVRHDYTPKAFLKKLQLQYKNNTLKNPAIIYNGIKAKGIGGYGYRYGYGYGYGYTEDVKNNKKWRNFFRG
jgi:capsular exopolysaccharide synthesis family protein